MLEGGAHSDELRAYLESNSISPVVKVARGTIWPRAELFHLPAMTATLAALAEEMERRNAAELCWHLHVYDAQGVVLEWYDAFDQPMWISNRVPVIALDEFCRTLGASWTDGEPAAR